MADKKISELPVLTNADANDADIVPIVDVSAGITSKITLAELLLRFQGNDGPAGPTGATGATGPQGPAGAGVINGGTANQALTKIDATDGNTQWSTIDKTFVGLGNADNTSDLNKPISTATQAALDLKASASDLTTHTGAVSGAHAASAISNTPSGNLAATDVQGALNELQSDIDTRALSSDLTTHTSASTGVHGVTGAVVGTTDIQTVSNKRLDDSTTEFADSVDPTTRVIIDAAGSPNSATFLTSSQTTDRTVTLPDATTTLLGTDASQTVTNKDINGGTASNSNRITIPKNTKANLDALTRKEATIVYATDQSKAYIDDGSNLQEIGSGGGSINFIDNPDGSLGTTGWTEGSYTAATRPSGTFTASSGTSHFEIDTTVLNPLGTGTTSFRLIKTAGVNEQGRAIETSFALPLSYRAKVLKIRNDYIIDSGTFVAGSSTTDSSMIWYCAFSTDSGSTYTVAEPSSFKLLSNSTTISDVFMAEIKTPYNATHMKLIAYVAETATTSWEVRCITSVSPSEYVYGTPITDWQSYTPTFGGGTLGNGTLEGFWRRVGDSVELRIKHLFGSTGTSTGGAFYWSLPSGLVIDSSNTSKFPTTGTGFRSGIGTTWYDVSAAVFKNITSSNYNTTSVFVVVDGAGNLDNTHIASGQTDMVNISYSVPILGWSSSVQMSDGYDGRVVAAKINNATATLSSTPSKVTYSTVEFDDVGAFSSGTYRVKSAGKYKVHANLLITRTATVSGNAIGVYIYKNGSTHVGTVFRDQSTETQSRSVNVSDILNLNAGDTIEIYAYAEGTSPAIISDSIRNYLIIEKLSGSPTISATETVSALYTGAPPTGTINTSWNTVTFGTKVKDSHGAYSGGVYTIPVSGQYDIVARVLASGISNGFGDIAIFIDGVQMYNGFLDGSSGNRVCPSVSVLAVPLTAGKQVTIKFSSDITSAAYSTSPKYNFFSINRSGGY